MRPARLVLGLVTMGILYGLFSLSCEKATKYGSSNTTEIIDSAVNTALLGTYYGLATTDYHTLNRRTEVSARVHVYDATADLSGCTCIYDISLSDSTKIIAQICTRGKPSKLTSNCTSSEYHDVFLATGDGATLRGILERYKIVAPGVETHWCTISISADKR